MNAIILAAGLGSRLLPETKDIPKPLIKINGAPIIERQILYLKEIGIHEIFVVVGYNAGLFEYLKDKYGVALIYNPYYGIYNNFYSMYLCRDVFGDSFVIEGDSYPTRNFLPRHIDSSAYFTGPRKKIVGEWILQFSDDKVGKILITADSPPLLPDESHYIMSGFSFWKMKDALLIKDIMNTIIDPSGAFLKKEYINNYWDHMIVENIGLFSIFPMKIGPDDWHEIDTPSDLKALKAIK